MTDLRFAFRALLSNPLSVLLTTALLGLGIAAVVAAAPALRSMLYQLSPYDPQAFAAAALFLSLTALLSSIGPALNAFEVEPAETLRLEV